MADAAQEGRGLAMIERHQSLRNGVLAPALGVALDGLFEEAVEGTQQIGQEFVDPHLGGDFGGLGDHQVDAVGQGFPEGNGGLVRASLAQTVERLDFGFDLAMRHNFSITANRATFGWYAASKMRP